MPNKIHPTPWWQQDRFERRRPFLDVRSKVLRATRHYFESEEFSEVDTPALQISPGNEVHLHAFATEFIDIHSNAYRSYYLHTSPEFSMKKLLVAGLPKIFQLSHVFRNGERSSRHHPEFSMLEWYRQGAKLEQIKKDCVALVRTCARAAGIKHFSTQEMACDPFLEWENLSIADAFTRYTKIDLMKTINNRNLLADQMKAIGLRASENDGWDDLFFRCMGEKIEPYLGKDRPTFLCDYPIHMAALARAKRDDPRFAERFELYICGYELANAFDELTDAKEQEKRFKEDMALKEQLYGKPHPIDSDFIEALQQGMPDSSGIALGFDRLVMLCSGALDIEDVLWVPVAP